MLDGQQDSPLSPGGALLVSPPATVPRLASAGADFQGLAEEALAFADAAEAPATRRAYNSAWAAFTTWCASHGQDPLPASAGTMAFYLTWSARRLKVSSLRVHRAAIVAAHLAGDHVVPDSAELRLVWEGIRKKLGRPADKKRGLTPADLKRAIKSMPTTPAGIRDRAVLLVGLASAMRRSELAPMVLETPIAGDDAVRVRFVAEGLEIAIGKSKGDRYGRGAVVAVPHGRHAETCPVRALRAWLSAAGIVEGPVFRAVDNDRVSDVAICDRTVARIVKAAAARAGLEPGAFAAHSLRRGMITAAFRAGGDRDAIQSHARHARWDTTREYLEESQRFGKSNAAGKLGL